MVKNIFPKQNAYTRHSGVTLIELMVVLGIVALVASVLLFNYSDFSTNISIRNLSQEVALSIRKSQTYATSVQGVSVSSGDRSYPSYGIVFSLEPNYSLPYLPNPKRFISFADIVPDGDTLPNKIYNSAGSECGNVSSDSECLESISITSADTLFQIETDATGIVSSGTVSITFRRPSPDAIICFIPSGESACLADTISYVSLYFKSAKDLVRKVSVWNTGQITVE